MKYSDEMSHLGNLALAYYFGWIIYLVTAISMYAWKAYNMETTGLETFSMFFILMLVICVITSAIKDQKDLITKVLVMPESTWVMVFMTVVSFLLSTNIIGYVEDFIYPFDQVKEMTALQVQLEQTYLVDYPQYSKSEALLANLTYFVDTAMAINVLSLASWVQVSVFFPLVAILSIRYKWDLIVSKWDDLLDRFWRD